MSTVLLIIFVVLVLFLSVIYFVSPIISPKPYDVNGKHALVTGGSSGIGKAIAAELAKRGASVTLLARNQSRLSAAKQETEKHLKNKDKQRVICISVDIGKDGSAVEKSVRQAEEILGPVDILINCAGWSTSGRFEDTPVSDFKTLLDINYMGSVYATKAVIKRMKERHHGRIVFISSVAGQLGVFGYSAYAGSKFALRGLAESLQMEVKPYNIQVTLAFPPDTDTPGFAEENIVKGLETKLISETAGLFQAEYVAKAIIEAAVAGQFLCPIGFDGYMTTIMTAGASPVTSVMEATLQVLLMGIIRAVFFFYLDSFDRIVRKCKQQREERGTEAPPPSESS